MKHSLKKLIPLLLLTLAAYVVVFSGTAHAQGIAKTIGGALGMVIDNVGNLFGLPFMDFVTQFCANIVNLLLSVMGSLVTLSGVFLNIAMKMTLNIKAFVSGTSAIYTTWAAIRDISDMFIIFFLLWAAIEMIIGVRGAGWGKLIKNIVIAGVLINFSFFFTSLGIDVSNIVSMQLYNAIAPANDLNAGNIAFQSQGAMAQQLKTPGLSDIFMQSLMITDVYKTSLAPYAPRPGNTSSGTAANSVSAPLKVILMGVTGLLIEFCAAVSFTIAAMSFIIRFVILLILLAFSPIWFASHMIPQIGDYAKKWTTWYKDMLLFMPVYLLLMYMALNVLTTSDFFKNGYVGNLIANPANDTWYSNFLILGVNAAIVIVLLNMPLIVAFKMGGVATTLFSKTGLTAGGVWGKVSGWAGRNTVGKGASWADKKLSNMPLGNSLLARDLRGASLGALAGAKMGGNRSYTEQAKEMKEVTKKGKEIDRKAALVALTRNDRATFKDYKDVMGTMSEPEKLALGPELLKNPQIAKQLKKDDFSAIKKSEDMKPEDKQEILKNTRKDALTEAVNNNEGDAVKFMLKNMETDDIVSIDPGMLTNPNLIAHLTSGQLKALTETDLPSNIREQIANTIVNWRNNANNPNSGRKHPAAGWINKNMEEWTGVQGAGNPNIAGGGGRGIGGGTGGGSTIIIPPSSPNRPRSTTRYP